MSFDVQQKKKILLVDDDEMYLTMAELFLKDNYEVYKAHSGVEALDLLLKSFAPDLILLDILMPDMDGWEVLRRIRAISLLKDTPIAFLTSVEGDIKKESAYKMGIDDYITKPYNMTDLRNRVSDLLKN